MPCVASLLPLAAALIVMLGLSPTRSYGDASSRPYPAGGGYSGGDDSQRWLWWMAYLASSWFAFQNLFGAVIAEIAVAAEPEPTFALQAGEAANHLVAVANKPPTTTSERVTNWVDSLVGPPTLQSRLASGLLAAVLAGCCFTLSDARRRSTAWQAHAVRADQWCAALFEFASRHGSSALVLGSFAASFDGCTLIGLGYLTSGTISCLSHGARKS